MHCIRRAALRTAISASRQVAPKTSVAPLAQATFKPLAAPRQSLVQAVRCFSQTARFQNVEEQTQGEEQLTQQLNEESTTEQPRSSDAATRPTPENGVFVRNLIFDATEKHLVAAFEKYGEVVEANIARDARGLSRGYGFVYFKDPKAAEEAITAVDGTFWHGRRVGVSARTVGRDGGRERRHEPRAKKEPTTTLYIGNIPYETTDAELNAIFRELPNVTDIRVAVDRTTGWPRGFAHADFANVESAIKAHDTLQGYQMGERNLVVDYSEQKNAGPGAGPGARPGAREN